MVQVCWLEDVDEVDRNYEQVPSTSVHVHVCACEEAFWQLLGLKSGAVLPAEMNEQERWHLCTFQLSVDKKKKNIPCSEWCLAVRLLLNTSLEGVGSQCASL